MSADHARMIAGLLEVGVVAELDASRARVRVDAAGMLTDWLPWITRAGPGVREYGAYEVGEQVLIACPYGDPNQGVVVGAIYQDAYPAPANVATKRRTEYADGTVIEYDREQNQFSLHVGSGSVVIHCRTAVVSASESVTLDAPTTKATGDLEVSGAIQAGKDISTSADVKAGSISLKQHKHTAQGATAPTTAAQ